MTFLIPTGFAPVQEGPTIQVGGNGGISGCVRGPFGIEICGQIGGAGPVPDTNDPSGNLPLQETTVSSGCPEGTFRVGNTCVDILAAAPGGDPLTQPARANGCENNGIPKVSAQHMVTPILWKSTYGCKPGAGYRLNKSAFFRMDPESGNIVRVPKESAWVKGRRRNASNMRATDRAISRVKSAKDFTASMGRVQVKSKADWKAQKARRKK